MQISIKDDIKKYYDLWFSINAIYEKWAKAHGITSNTLFIYYIINEYSGSCTQHSICEKLQLPKQTVNTILQVIEKNGYIKKVPTQKDKRSKAILFTDLGKQYIERIMRELYSFEEFAFSKMDSIQRTNMLESNNNLVKNLAMSFDAIEKARSIPK